MLSERTLIVSLFGPSSEHLGHFPGILSMRYFLFIITTGTSSVNPCIQCLQIIYGFFQHKAVYNSQASNFCISSQLFPAILCCLDLYLPFWKELWNWAAFYIVEAPYRYFHCCPTTPNSNLFPSQWDTWHFLKGLCLLLSNWEIK